MLRAVRAAGSVSPQSLANGSPPDAFVFGSAVAEPIAVRNDQLKWSHDAADDFGQSVQG